MGQPHKVCCNWDSRGLSPHPLLTLSLLYLPGQVRYFRKICKSNSHQPYSLQESYQIPSLCKFTPHWSSYNAVGVVGGSLLELQMRESQKAQCKAQLHAHLAGGGSDIPHIYLPDSKVCVLLFRLLNLLEAEDMGGEGLCEEEGP